MSRPLAAVTGSTGFLGVHLVRALHQAGFRVRALARREPAQPGWGGAEPEVVAGDLSDGSSLERLVDGAAVVVHVAGAIRAPDLAAFMAVNRDGSARLADAVREGRRREFAKFPAFADPQAREAIPDPNALATFDRSRPTPGPDAEAWRALIAELMALRHTHLVPHLDDARSLGSRAIGKAAVVARFGEPSLLVRRRHEEAGTPFEQRDDVDHETFKAHGGSLPIRVRADLVGSITTSGEPDVVDHDVASEAVRRFLSRS